jgi:hypothetical protein
MLHQGKLIRESIFSNTVDKMFPFASVGTPRLLPPETEWPQDNQLTNLYRRLHNLDSIQRSEVFQFNDALAGGSYNAPIEPYIGARYDRAMMDLKSQIRQDIAAKRRPYSELYDTPTKPIFNAMNDDYRILGIPSQLGVQPYYY